jgi:hypothetical protein
MPHWLKSPWFPSLAALAISLLTFGMVVAQGSDSPVLPGIQALTSTTVGAAPRTSTDGRLAAVEQQLASLQASAGSSAPSTPPQSPTEMEAARLRDNRAAIQRGRAERQQLDARFAKSPSRGAADGRLASNLSQQMGEEALMGVTDPPVRDDIACRGELCRMEFVFADPASAENWANFYPVAVAGQLDRVDSFSEPGPDGTTTLLLYGTVRKR